MAWEESTNSLFSSTCPVFWGALWLFWSPRTRTKTMSFFVLFIGKEQHLKDFLRKRLHELEVRSSVNPQRKKIWAVLWEHFICNLFSWIWFTFIKQIVRAFPSKVHSGRKKHHHNSCPNHLFCFVYINFLGGLNNFKIAGTSTFAPVPQPDFSGPTAAGLARWSWGTLGTASLGKKNPSTRIRLMFLKGIVLHRDTEIPELDEFRWIFVQSYHFLVSFHDVTSDLATKKSFFQTDFPFRSVSGWWEKVPKKLHI